MSDYYSGYSLYRPSSSQRLPVVSMNDWLNPVGMFPTVAMQQQNFFKGAPVRAPDSNNHRPDSKMTSGNDKEKAKPRVPCSNVPTRALKRVPVFAARDWTSIQPTPMHSTLPVQPIDAELSPITEKPSADLHHSTLWQPSLSTQQQYAPANWLSKTADRPQHSRRKGLVAVGESDSDSGKEEQDERDHDHDQWMRELVATVNSVMMEQDVETPTQTCSNTNTKNQFQFEWLHQAKRGGESLSSQ